MAFTAEAVIGKTFRRLFNSSLTEEVFHHVYEEVGWELMDQLEESSSVSFPFSSTFSRIERSTSSGMGLKVITGMNNAFVEASPDPRQRSSVRRRTDTMSPMPSPLHSSCASPFRRASSPPASPGSSVGSIEEAPLALGLHAFACSDQIIPKLQKKSKLGSDFFRQLRISCPDEDDEDSRLLATSPEGGSGHWAFPDEDPTDEGEDGGDETVRILLAMARHYPSKIKQLLIFKVDPSAPKGTRGVYSTIGDAVNHGYSGCEIHVMPGRYVENLKIVKGLKLLGQGDRSKIVIEGSVSCLNPGVLISNITVTQGPRQKCALYIESGNVVIDECTIQASAGGMCIDVFRGKGKQATCIRQSTLLGGDVGISVNFRGTLLVNGTKLHGQEKVGIDVIKGARSVSMGRCEILVGDNAMGIYVHKYLTGNCTVEHCTIETINSPGIRLTGGRVTLRHNSVRTCSRGLDMYLPDTLELHTNFIAVDNKIELGSDSELACALHVSASQSPKVDCIAASTSTMTSVEHNGVVSRRQSITVDDPHHPRERSMSIVESVLLAHRDDQQHRAPAAVRDENVRDRVRHVHSDHGSTVFDEANKDIRNNNKESATTTATTTTTTASANRRPRGGHTIVLSHVQARLELKGNRVRCFRKNQPVTPAVKDGTTSLSGSFQSIGSGL
mmetsp:Transcript_6119/g.9424  ORF Transcript_6119/g.9424 Transcript_6119/m.9424 type:complete len:671 (+) Transcript_6119:150-2162(+)|eukprot:CAMPEP_0184649478 /NCGR_PEP_ID=MMETSP0308-20130426/6864_1 /TAXON_ID=38269 /ORGANISM="Gloeochaete witrockiana, Strain SAG 46.84" /LENGTH=670 /DNA_ID=CAMNT_0027082241 /DNA_START=91 /DNA_END=2103 /DNA_ORIENTATION=-